MTHFSTKIVQIIGAILFESLVILGQKEAKKWVFLSAELQNTNFKRSNC